MQTIYQGIVEPLITVKGADVVTEVICKVCKDEEVSAKPRTVADKFTKNNINLVYNSLEQGLVMQANEVWLQH